MLSKQKTNGQGITLEEMLLIPDVVYMSNWSKMASLIMTYEQIRWKEAGTKARELFKIKEAKDYLRAIRIDVAIENSLPDEELQPEEKTTGKKQKKKRFHKNYELLLKLAPELEQRLFEGKGVSGRSERTGHRNLYLYLFHRGKSDYFLSIGQYEDQDMDIPTPEMKIRLDMENRKLEALSFEDDNTYEEIYDNYLNPDSHRIKQKKQQNAYLTGWLNELIKQGHKIEFDLPQEPFVPVEQEDDEPEETTGISENEIQERNEQTIDTDNLEKLTDVVRQAELVDYETARLKAISLELAGEEKKLEYLCRVLHRQLACEENDLYRDNYDDLISIMPLLSEVNLEKISGILEPQQREVKRIQFEKSTAVNDKIHFIGFQYEDDPDEGVQIIAVNPRTKKAWLVERSEDFDGQAAYDISREKPNHDKRMEANRQLSKWLLSVDRNYHLAIDTLEFKQGQEIEWDDDVNSRIPDFEPGNVQLVAAHEKVGLDQEDIDWLNKHQRGLMLTPVLNISDDTRLIIKEMGVRVTYKRGFRISKTGKLYREEKRIA